MGIPGHCRTSDKPELIPIGNLFEYEITLTDNFTGKWSNRLTEFAYKNYRCAARIAICKKRRGVRFDATEFR